ncbi:MAG: lipid-A-disaccharide synthase [Zoogloeaceae bacterium]|jgi:lipid-A-disaccharide synthase|nr:lipid-A-disaccharide synthase [Zoogloeaceae bacterium]
MNPSPLIALCAGETSGDTLGAHLVEALKARLPQARFVGIGGPKMGGQGVDLWWPAEKLAVMGYAEVLRRFREILGIRKAFLARLLGEKPDLFIGIDAPDFNLGLEIALREQGVRTIHYVSPSIWAWRGERINKIGRAANRVLALFPMEPPLYEAAGIAVSYVGHPLADAIPETTDKAAVRALLELPRAEAFYALLPGSRLTELEALADLFIETACRIVSNQPTALFLVPLATRATRDAFEAALYRQKAPQQNFKLLFGHAQEALGACDAALIASGTACLEAALIKRPMVITYKVAPLSYWLMKRRAYLPWVGLPNILAGRQIVPELLQKDATPEKLATALVDAATPDNAQRLLPEYTRIHRMLRQNTTQKAADAVLLELGQGA